jgi:hypothetical protein
MAGLIGGLAVADPLPRPWLIARGALALALVFAEQGGRHMAEDLLAGTRRLYPRVEDPHELVRLSWLEGRLLARIGDVGMARGLLETVRSRYFSKRQLPEAALATLELGALPGGRRKKEASFLAQELQEHFAGVQGLEEIVTSLRGLGTEGGPTPASLLQSAEILRKLIRDQGHPFEPLPFA